MFVSNKPELDLGDTERATATKEMTSDQITVLSTSAITLIGFH